MESSRPDTASASSSTVSEATTSPNTSTGSSHNTPSYWHDCKTPEPLPQAPQVLEACPIRGVLTMQHGQGFEESDWDMSDPVVLKATKAEVRTLAQHHLDRTFLFSVWFSTEGAGSSDIARQFYHFDRFHELQALLDAEDRGRFDEIIGIRKEYIRELEAEEVARNEWEADEGDRDEWGPNQAAREEWEANQDPRD